MSSGFSDDFKELVRSRTDIVRLIGESLSLQPKGREFVGLCPFHEDHNPSLRVNPERQSYKCWSCGAGGDCFKFVMEKDRLGFRETLEMLAERANLEIPKSLRKSNTIDRDSKTRMYEALAWAENEFHQCLLTAPFADRARKYLADRKFTAETIRQFKLGYHPDNNEWLISRAGKKFSLELLEAVKLVGRNDFGKYYDHFEDRVMFPICDERNRPVAFGGRILPDSRRNDPRKYWNSPESPVFYKSKLVYALSEAREAIKKTNTVVVMEGYTDCIMAHQCGVTNVVGTLGTALTETHVTALKRFAQKVVLVYDGDTPGQAASERALPKFLAQEVDLRILTLPEQFDPDEFLLERGAEPFKALLETAEEAWQKKLRLTIARHGLDSIDARHRVLQDMLQILAEVPVGELGLSGSWQLRENVILGGLSQRLGLSEEKIRELLAEVRSKKPLSAPKPAAVNSATTGEAFPSNPSVELQIERELIGHIFTSPESFPTIQQEVSVESLTHAGLRDLFGVCCQLALRGVAPSYERVTSAVENPDLKSLAALVIEHAEQIGLVASNVPVTLKAYERILESRQSSLGGGPHLISSSSASGGAAGSADDIKARLRLATERHQKRISKSI